MTRYLLQFSVCVWQESPAWLQWFLGLGAVALGLFVALPFETTTPPFAPLGRIVPEWFWGTMLFLSGLGQLYAVCRDRITAQAIGAFCGILSWLFLFAFTFFDNWRHVSLVFYAGSCLGWTLILFKLPLAPFDRAFLWWDKLEARFIAER